MKAKTQTLLSIIGILLELVFSLSMVLFVGAIFLMFVNAHMEQAQDLPNLMKMALPLGLIVIWANILARKWWPFPIIVKNKYKKKENLKGE